MAGRKHHHVPQFLQRRFGQKSAKSTQVYVYSLDKEPFISNTAGYGAERDFYADGKDSYIDDLITDFESDIQSFVFRLIDGDQEALKDTRTISALVAHLEMRSSFLRDQLTEISGVMIDFIQDFFSDRRNMIAFMQKYIREHPETLRGMLTEAFGKDAPVSELEAFITPQLLPLIAQQGALISEAFSNELISLRKVLEDAVKPGHLKALNENPREVGRTRFYTNLKYTIQRAPIGSFILPDTMIAFCTRKHVSPFTQSGDELVELVLPLASDCVLVGSTKFTKLRGAKELNSMLASISLEKFIALEDRPEFRSLVGKIGRNAKMFTKSDLNTMYRSFVKDVLLK